MCDTPLRARYLGGGKTHPDPLGMRVSFRPNVTLKQLLVRTKDCIPENETAGVVYQVPCASCPATYVGQTDRHLTNDSVNSDEQLS